MMSFTAIFWFQGHRPLGCQGDGSVDTLRANKKTLWVCDPLIEFYC